MESNDELNLPNVTTLIRDGKVYAVTETELPQSRVLSEIKSFYEESYKRMKRDVVDEQFSLYDVERRKQIEHIEQVIARNKAIVPGSLYGEPVMYYKDSICELRWVDYKPNVVTSDAHRLKRWSYESDYERVRNGYSKLHEGVKDFASDDRVVIKINQNLINVRILFAYSETRNLVYSPFIRTFHVMSGSDLCTGDYTAKDFWVRADFNALVNVVNLFSLAIDSVNSINWQTLLKDEFIVEIGKEVMWRVRG